MFALFDNRFLCAAEFKTMRIKYLKFQASYKVQNIAKFWTYSLC